MGVDGPVAVLLVEDDPQIRATTRMVLEDEGYEVEDVATGEEGLELLAGHRYAAVILDIGLPGVDGYEVCRRIRRVSNVLVFMLTARTDTADIVAGLEAGADDYVTKPFQPKELLARLRAHLRRAAGSNGHESHPILQVGDLDVRPGEGVVTCAGDRVQLTPTEFRLLCELAEQAGRIVSRDVLLERVWGDGHTVDAKLLDTHVHRLRTKIELDPAQPARLLTMRGLGYKLQP